MHSYISKLLRSLCALVVFGFSILSLSCGGDDDDGPDGPLLTLTGLTVRGDPSSILVGETKTYTVTQVKVERLHLDGEIIFDLNTAALEEAVEEGVLYVYEMEAILEITETLTWASSDSDVATVSADEVGRDGVHSATVTGRAEGEVRIEASVALKVADPEAFEFAFAEAQSETGKEIDRETFEGYPIYDFADLEVALREPVIEAKTCGRDEHVVDQECVTCPEGSTNEAGDDTAGKDTDCEPTLCSEDEHVVEHTCLECDPGSTNEPGDDASRRDTECDATLCGADERVRNHECVACGLGSTNSAGDDASGANTRCTPTLCAADQFVISNSCENCPLGTTNAAEDDASGADTACDRVLCEENERVVSNECLPCPPGSTSPPGSDASTEDTTCEPIQCAIEEHVTDNACELCPNGCLGTGQDASGPDTDCVCG